MDDAEVVGGFEGLGNLPRDGQGLRQGDRPARDDRGQVLTLDQLHDESTRTAWCRPGFEAVDLRDVRVIQRGQGLRFAREARQPLGIEGEVFGEDLDGNVAIELRVPRTIDLTHAAFAELLQDAIGTKGLANHSRVPVLGFGVVSP